MENNIKIEKTARAMLGECPVWDHRKNVLYYIDIDGKSLRKYDPVTKEESVLPTPQKVGSLALCKDGRLLVALEDGIYFIDEKKMTPAHKKVEIEGARFNDGKVGPDGRFYVGTMARKNEDGAFYSLDKHGHLKKLFNNVKISNGMDWSHDGKKFYYIDTMLHRIDAFDFNAAHGKISGGVTVFDFGEEYPDGMCIDADGNLNVAIWGGGRIMTINPNTGEVVGTICTPAEKTSNLTFGGRELDTMFITSACIDDESDYAGMLISRKSDVKGVKANIFG